MSPDPHSPKDVAMEAAVPVLDCTYCGWTRPGSRKLWRNEAKLRRHARTHVHIERLPSPLVNGAAPVRVKYVAMLVSRG